MKDLLEKIEDLHKQATKEKSHFYVGSILKECYTEISCLRLKIEMISKIIGQKIPPTTNDKEKNKT